MGVDASSVERFVSNYAEIRESVDALNEQDTKHMIINPFLMMLGWNFVPKEITAEHPVKMGSGTHRVDYCLKVDGSPVAFLEAKPLGSELTDNVLSQAVSYGRVEFVQWCLVTNGDEVVLLNSQIPGADPRGAVVLRFPLARIHDYRHYLDAISPDGFRQNVIEQLADDIAQRRALLERFQADRQRWGEELTRAALGYGVAESMARDASEEFLNRIRAGIEHPTRVPPRSVQPARPSRPEESSASSFRTLSRDELTAHSDGTVAVFPCNPSGLSFVREYAAWGFVRIGQVPEFCALYVTAPVQEIRVVARLKDVVPAPEWRESVGKLSERAFSHFNPDKLVVRFDPQHVYELKDPIPFRKGDPHVQGLRYASLESFIRAKTVGDLQTPDR